MSPTKLFCKHVNVLNSLIKTKLFAFRVTLVVRLCNILILLVCLSLFSCSNEVKELHSLQIDKEIKFK